VEAPAPRVRPALPPSPAASPPPPPLPHPRQTRPDFGDDWADELDGRAWHRLLAEANVTINAGADVALMACPGATVKVNISGISLGANADGVVPAYTIKTLVGAVETVTTGAMGCGAVNMDTTSNATAWVECTALTAGTHTFNFTSERAMQGGRARGQARAGAGAREQGGLLGWRARWAGRWRRLAPGSPSWPPRLASPAHSS
jgi:hypothetical protein